MAFIYNKNESFSGPVEEPVLHQDFNELPEEEKEYLNEKLKKQQSLFIRGRNRIMKKTKEIRQTFSKEVVSGSRSRSGKLVFLYYDDFVDIREVLQTLTLYFMVYLVAAPVLILTMMKKKSIAFQFQEQTMA